MVRNLDINMLSKKPRLMAVISSAAGLLYVTAAVMQILEFMGIVSLWFLTPDLVTIFVLLVLAAVFLSGVSALRLRQKQAIAYPTAGLLLSALLFLLKLTILLTNALGWVLSFEDWQSWSVVMDIEPTLWTFPIVVVMFAAVFWHSDTTEKMENRVDTHDL
ncbi:hypothetical protein EU537_09765 [Candidatus Thorarchaeota archaeon]|nr:MAG: hypothetical protein EU537_09765 [Candidatus Thorarchaeota archaeon]